MDANVVRLYGRFFGFRTGAESRRDRQLLHLADNITPKRAFRTFNYALIDLTRAICRPKPAHQICPLVRKCRYYSEHLAQNSKS